MCGELDRKKLINLVIQLTQKSLELEEQLEQARKREKIWYELWREKN